MSVEIATYKTGVHRGTDKGPVRWLNLEISKKAQSKFEHIAIYFYENPNDNMGYVNVKTGFVVPFLPIADYEPMYHLLQTEKPVYASWMSDDQDGVTWFGLGTSSEPLGEGFRDGSR